MIALKGSLRELNRKFSENLDRLVSAGQINSYSNVDFFSAFAKGKVDGTPVSSSVGGYTLEAKVYNHLTEEKDTLNAGATTATVDENTIRHIYYVQEITLRDSSFEPKDVKEWMKKVDQNLPVVFGYGFDHSRKLSNKDKSVYCRASQNQEGSVSTDIIEVCSDGTIKHYAVNKENNLIMRKIERSLLETYASNLAALLMDPADLGQKKDKPLTDFQQRAKLSREDLTAGIRKMPSGMDFSLVSTDKSPYAISVYLNHAGDIFTETEEGVTVAEPVYWVKTISVMDNNDKNTNADDQADDDLTKKINAINDRLTAKTKLFLEQYQLLEDNDNITIKTRGGDITYQAREEIKPVASAYDGNAVTVYFRDASVQKPKEFEFVPLTLHQIRRLANGLMYILDRTLKDKLKTSTKAA
ncbi:TPA: hypothetical protein HA246_03595 [Candidatus Woesearchaeota archaeon]|nr:hypothetical protein [Candidatus Woesearchaeota archaeon]